MKKLILLLFVALNTVCFSQHIITPTTSPVTQVLSNRILTINGVSYDLSANRSWSISGGSGSGWGLTGNSITSGQYLGTTNSQPLLFKVNNNSRLNIASSGKLNFYSDTVNIYSSILGGSVFSATATTPSPIVSIGDVNGASNGTNLVIDDTQGLIINNGTTVANQGVYGGVLGSGNLILGSTTSGTKGKIYFGANAYYNEAKDVFHLPVSTYTAPVNGDVWYSGATNNGFDLYSDDPTNAGYLFSVNNSINYLRYYADHSNNNWLTVRPTSSFIFSTDNATTASYEIDQYNHVWTVHTATSNLGGAVYRWNSSNHTGQTASTEVLPFAMGPSGIQYNTGALARQRAFNFAQMTVSFVGASTLTDGADFWIGGPLIAGTNATITNNSALMVGGITGTTSIGAGTTNGYGLTVYAPTGATNNYAARFMQGNVGIGTSAPAFPLDVTGSARITSTLTVGGIAGTTTNNNTSAGNVGEYLTTSLAVGSAITLTTATAVNIATISLTAGDWDVYSVLDYTLTTATATHFKSGVSTTSVTFGAQDTFDDMPLIVTALSDVFGNVNPAIRLSLASTTTVYLIGNATFSAGTVKGYGSISARRAR